MDHEERTRKKEARMVHKRAKFAQKVHGLRAKLFQKKRYKEKAAMRKTIKQHQEKDNKHKNKDAKPEGALPAYLLDRESVSRRKFSATRSNRNVEKKLESGQYRYLKLKRSQMLKYLRSCDRVNAEKKLGKDKSRKQRSWGEGFTRKAPKYERFIRPTGMRFKKAHVTHPELQATFCLKILGVKKNPQSALYTDLGVITKGTIIEVNVSELGSSDDGKSVVWGKYAHRLRTSQNWTDALMLFFWYNHLFVNIGFYITN